MEPYRSYFPNSGLLLTETERLSEKILVLPTGSSLTGEDIESICNLIRFAVTNGEEIEHRLSMEIDVDT